MKLNLRDSSIRGGGGAFGFSIRYQAAILPLLSGIALSLVPLAAFAAKPSQGVRIIRGDQFDRETTPKGKAVTCYNLVPGTVKKRGANYLFTPASLSYNRALDALKHKKGKLGKKKYAAAQKKLAAGYADSRAGCHVAPEESLSPYTRNLNYRDVHLLYRRGGFGASIVDLYECSGKPASVCVSRLMAYDPGLTSALIQAAESYLDDDSTNQRFAENHIVNSRGLASALGYLMTNTNSPFWGRQVLNLMQHYAVPFDTVFENDTQRAGYWTNNLNKIFVHAADGDMKALSKEQFFDEAQQVSLTGDQNTRFSPNQNLGREFLELFNLGALDTNGQANYTEEEDIPAISRAFTGYSVEERPIFPGADQKIWSWTFSGQLADQKVKTMWAGKPWQANVVNAEDVIKATQAHPEWARHLARRMLQNTLSADYPKGLVEKLATIIRQDNGNVLRAYRTLFTSKAFYSPKNRGEIVTPNAVVIIRFVRQMAQFGMPYSISRVRDGFIRAGQQLGNPDTVFGFMPFHFTYSNKKLELRNTLVGFISDTGLFAKQTPPWSMGSMLKRIPPEISGKGLSAPLVRDLAAYYFGVQLDEEVQAQLDQFMNKTIKDSKGTLGDQPWDPSNAAIANSRMAGLVAVIAQDPRYQVD